MMFVCAVHVLLHEQDCQVQFSTLTVTCEMTVDDSESDGSFAMSNMVSV